MESPDNRREADDSCWGALAPTGGYVVAYVFSPMVDQFSRPTTDARLSIKGWHEQTGTT